VINVEILKIQLQAIVENIDEYTSEPNIDGMCKNVLKSIESGDFDLFKYCCIGINIWYDENISSIYSNDYIFTKEGHSKSKKNIENIVKDLGECEEEYIRVFKSNNKIKSYELPIGEFNKVFIVHGRDNEAKLEVARYFERLGIEPIILHEQTNNGKTIIEKIEKYTDVGYAVVLYTPCDRGKLKGESGDGRFRARQNVVFEHGYLVGRIGRNRVSALVKGDIELPNDIAGVVYTPMDDAGGWKLEIAKEMKSVGYSIDMNKLF